MSVIVITAQIDMDPALRGEVLHNAQPLIAAALAERGCVAYTWSLDSVNHGRIHVFEEWADEAALTAHFAGAPYNDMRGMIATGKPTGSTSQKYRVDAIAPVYNAQAIATVDF